MSPILILFSGGEGALENAYEVVKASGGWREVPADFKVEPLEDLVKSYL